MSRPEHDQLHYLQPTLLILGTSLVMPYSTLLTIYSTLRNLSFPLLRIIALYSSWLRVHSIAHTLRYAACLLLYRALTLHDSTLLTPYGSSSLCVLSVHILCFLFSLKLSFKTRVLLRLTSSYSWALTLGLFSLGPPPGP